METLPKATSDRDKRNSERRLLQLAKLAESKFSESDWTVLGQLTGFRDRINNHPRLLRSLSFGDNDYLGNVIDVLNEMVDADPANLQAIESQLIQQGGTLISTPERYERLDLIGQGGYGQVYREYDHLLDFYFARKELTPSVFVKEDTVDRFLREARMLFNLSHPNIVRVYEVGRQGEEAAYIRMQLVAGKCLDQVGALNPEASYRYVYLIALALSHAHSQSVIHRDLKPSNILVNGDNLTLIDFGLGAFIDVDSEMALTPWDRSIGGGAYAAPELKDPAYRRDPRVDIFSLGALWYFMLTGRSPGGADTFESLTAVDGLPIAHKFLILKCMSSDPEKRPSGSLELLNLLDEKRPPEVEKLSGASDALSEDEIAVIGALASRYAYGSHLTSLEIEQHTLGAVGDSSLRLGIAMATLDARELISSAPINDMGGWYLTTQGKAWLTRNYALVISSL